MKIEFEGFHGTDYKSAQDILNDGFYLSKGDGHWLGDGVYLFVDGLNNEPDILAKEWAIAEAWSNKEKAFKYDCYAIVKAVIEVKKENFLDLTTSEGMKFYNYILDRSIEKVQEYTKNKLKYDGFVINFARNRLNLPIDVVKGNVYIKFVKERKLHLDSRISNCTICSVFSLPKNVKNIVLHFNGKIENNGIK